MIARRVRCFTKAVATAVSVTTGRIFLAVAAATFFAMPSVRVLRAQATGDAATSAIIRGTVTGERGEPLRYVIVALGATGQQQFTNQDGKFFFVQLRAGTYELTVRQLGYQPANRTVTVEAGATADVAVQMSRIAVQLATVRVRDEWACDRPGRPIDASARALIAVFEQLEQSALRMQLMARDYPFIATLERRRVELSSTGQELGMTVDSVRTESQAKSQYAPGNVVQRTSKRGQPAEYLLQVPTLLDFAAPAFQKNHCFQLRGVDSAFAVPRIRVDFKAWSKLKSPDVEGTVYLESGTFRLLATEIRLTKVPPDVRGLIALTAVTRFEEITSGLPTVLNIQARSNYRTFGLNAAANPVMLEDLRTLRVAFLRDRPDGVPDSTVPPL